MLENEQQLLTENIYHAKHFKNLHIGFWISARSIYPDMEGKLRCTRSGLGTAVQMDSRMGLELFTKGGGDF